MEERVYNFSAGPAMIAESVLKKAADELVCYPGRGMSVMEMSHRSGMYIEIFDRTKALLKELMNVPDDYEILFLQGGATLQFSAVPLNLLSTGKADYVDSGNFAHLAAEEAKKYADVHIAASSREDTYTYVPDTFDWRPDADYAYITTNNTIYGTRYTAIPDTGNVPLVADMSSNILSEPFDVTKFGVIFAGAQKNIGPAGLCIVIVRRDLMGHEDPKCPKLMSWALESKNDSMLNTPNTYGIYMAGLGFEWLKGLGGVSGHLRAEQVQGGASLRLPGSERAVQGARPQGLPLADERDLRHRRRRQGRGLRQVCRQERPGQPQGPPQRGRHARQHLQRHAGRGREEAGRSDEGL